MESKYLPLLDSAEALARLDDDMDLYQILIETFLEEDSFNPDTMENLVSSTQSKNEGLSEAAAKYVHHMKGAAAQLGAMRLAHYAQKLEDVLRGKSSGEATAIAKDVAELYRQTASLLKNV